MYKEPKSQLEDLRGGSSAASTVLEQTRVLRAGEKAV